MAISVRGKFVTFEGAEGSGKSTQINLIYELLQKKHKDILNVREPGGVKISESIRDILLDVKNKKMTSECETLLYMAARSQLVDEVIEPALKAGRIILCDRFLDSTVVYQGYGAGVDVEFIKKIGSFITHGITPDLTFVFDIDPEKGFARRTRGKDRIEERPLEYHRRVRDGYLALAKQEPKRIVVIDAEKSREEIHAVVLKHVEKVLG